MLDNLKDAQKAFNDYATANAVALDAYNERIAFIKEHFRKDIPYMEKLLQEEAERSADLIDTYYALLKTFTDLEQEYKQKAKPWASKKDSLEATQAEEMAMFGDWDEQIAWRHKKERGDGSFFVSPGIPDQPSFDVSPDVL